MSPDGQHVYVAGGIGDAVAVFSRNATTGRLTFRETVIDGVGGVDGLGGAWSTAVSPDGRHVYATGLADGAVTAFRRDPTDGSLAFVEVERDGVDGVEGLAGAWLVALSPDGTTVYVAGGDDDAVAVFRRDPASGTLAFVEVAADGANGVDGLATTRGVTPSPDGAHLYAAGFDDDAVAVFRVGRCGNGIVDPGECCDLGAWDGVAQSGCSATCGCTGQCSDGRVCGATADCAPGEGCCGDGVREAAEACDDGNRDDGDCCSPRCEIACDAGCVPACEGARGPHLMVARLGARFRDTLRTRTFNRWKLVVRKRNAFDRGPGVALDPRAEEVRVVLLEADGECPAGRRVLAEFGLAPDHCDGGPCWTTCRHGRCVFDDATETLSEPDGLRRARIAQTRDRWWLTVGGRSLATIAPPAAESMRVCVRVGDDVGTAVLRCTRDRSALTCSSVE